jgi:hypothetical protein
MNASRAGWGQPDMTALSGRAAEPVGLSGRASTSRVFSERGPRFGVGAADSLAPFP